jgi:putative flippase GtrA
MQILAKADVVLSRVCSNSPQFARYLGIGVIATLVDWTIFYLLIGYLGIFYMLALATSYFSSTALNFFLNRRYTFRNTYRKSTSSSRFSWLSPSLASVSMGSS